MIEMIVMVMLFIAAGAYFMGMTIQMECKHDHEVKILWFDPLVCDIKTPETWIEEGE